MRVLVARPRFPGAEPAQQLQTGGNPHRPEKGDQNDRLLVARTPAPRMGQLVGVRVGVGIQRRSISVLQKYIVAQRLRTLLWIGDALYEGQRFGVELRVVRVVKLI